MKKLATLMFLAAAPVMAQPGMQQGQGQMPDMAAMFMQRFDADKDGKVSLAEFLDPSEKQFRAMDTNGDGAIDQNEINAFDQMMRQRMEQMRKQQGGQDN